MTSSTRAIPITLGGGLNLASVPMELKPGECVFIHNYEINALGRYTRIMGYERFDGRPAPSATPKVISAELNDDELLDSWVTNREARRALIEPVPGIGAMRGVATYKGVAYAFRDNVAGTACLMYASSPQGWQLVATPALNPGGRYEFKVANFTGSLDTLELVGCDGKNPAFRFNGETFTQIMTGMEENGRYPDHLEVSASQILFLSYGSSLMYSGVGDPTQWAAPYGGEIAVGDKVVGLDIQANNYLAVFCRNTTYVLIGKTDNSWSLETLSGDTGAIEHTVQTIGDSIYLDDRGLTRLSRVQAFGNFDSATFSEKIEPLIQDKLGLVTASFVIKEKNQYRLCFSDGSGITITFRGADVVGFTTFDYGKVIRCVVSAEDADGREVVYFGSDDGYIYQAERDVAFDGQPYTSSLRPAFFDFRMPANNKRFRGGEIQAETPWKADLTVVPDFNYSSSEIPPHEPLPIQVLGGGGYWDQATWDEFRWSAASLFTAALDIRGVAKSISLFVTSTSDRQAPHTITSFIVYLQLKSQRR